MIYQFSDKFTRKGEENGDYKICDVKITNDGLIQSSKKVEIDNLRMITIRSLTEDKIVKEFTILLPQLVGIEKEGETKEEEEEEADMDLYEFLEYHNGYLYVKLDDHNPMRVYDVEYNIYFPSS